MAHSYVLTNRKRLDAFLRRGGELASLLLRVGVLSGKPKYPRGHRGARSDDRKRRTALRIDPREKARRRQIRQAKRHLQEIESKSVRKLELKRLRSEFRKQGVSSRGLGRKRAGAVAVARVAGVMEAFSQYHTRGMEWNVIALERGLESVRAALFGRGDLARAIQDIGRNAKAAVRASLSASGHVDTRRLLRNIQYEIVDKPGKTAALASARAARRAARETRRAARRAR